MTQELETAGFCTRTWWTSSNDMFTTYSTPHSTDTCVDINSFDWQNIDILDASTYNESHLNTSTFLGNSNLDSTLQSYVSNQSNVLEEEERFNSINSVLEGLFDSSDQVSVANYAKPELLESFHFFDDIFFDESRTVPVFAHGIVDKPKEDTQAGKYLVPCKRASEKIEELDDVESLQPLKKPRLETPSQFPSFKVRKEKLGDRITALQQLVSPFGKTDTASVLNDAVEYIKFLQEQITVSCTNPHLNSRGSGEQKQFSDKPCNNSHDQDSSPRQDLRSRGLCLMPISSTFSTSPRHLDASSLWNLPSCVSLN